MSHRAHYYYTSCSFASPSTTSTPPPPPLTVWPAVATSMYVLSCMCMIGAALAHFSIMYARLYNACSIQCVSMDHSLVGCTVGHRIQHSPPPTTNWLTGWSWFNSVCVQCVLHQSVDVATVIDWLKWEINTTIHSDIIDHCMVLYVYIILYLLFATC